MGVVLKQTFPLREGTYVCEIKRVMGHAVTRKSVLTIFLKKVNEATIRITHICVMNDLIWLDLSLFQSPRTIFGRTFILH